MSTKEELVRELCSCANIIGTDQYGCCITNYVCE